MSTEPGERIEAQALLWRWQAATSPAAWHFLTLDGPAADAIRAAAAITDRGQGGFGSVKVSVTIGATRWRTSLFPHRESGGWLLPVKKAVRLAEGLAEGDAVRLVIEL